MLTIPNRVGLWWGFPPLVLYLFVLWAAMVAVVAWAVTRGSDGDKP